MDLATAAPILAELGNETRLAIVRLLVRAGDEGLSVGEVQRAIGVPGSTLSHHLQRLRGVGLISQTRDGSTLWCRAALGRIRDTADFLIEECCADAGARHGCDAA